MEVVAKEEEITEKILIEEEEIVKNDEIVETVETRKEKPS